MRPCLSAGLVGGRAIGIVLAGGLMLVPAAGTAADGSQERSARDALLDVPYVSQTPELCGGASVSMVLRYWGARDVFPQDFASLVGRHDGGIRTDALASAVRDLGWQTLVVPATGATAHGRLRSEIDLGRPLIALIEVAPRTYHYVVIVGSTDDVVVLHDPARAPFRVASWPEFDRVWTAAGRWMLRILPPADDGAVAPAARAVAPRSIRPPSSAQTPCDGLVERGVLLATAGDRGAAWQALSAAARLCPSDPAPWRELAGLRFSEARWSEAEALALTAARLEPDDGYTWQLIATSRYLATNRSGALDAWNRADEPRIDAIDIHGAERTPHPVVVRAAGLEPRQLLTSSALEQALRRLSDLPVASNARITYEPLGEGLVRVDAVIDERPRVPRGWIALATLGARALLQHEARVDVSGALGLGEAAGGSWRWLNGRPRVRFDFAAPSPGRLPGVLSVDWSWEQQSYSRVTPGAPATVRLTRRRAAFHLSDWQSAWARWQLGVAVDRFDARNTAALEGVLDLRFAADRVALVTSAEWWVPLRAPGAFTSGGFLAAWRSTADHTHPSLSAMTQIRAASPRAPLDLWHGAGTGQGRSGLLRAHPLLDDGVFVGPVFGRVVAHGSVEYTRPVVQAMGGSLAIAGFVDAARAWRRLNAPGPSALYVDAGIGLRARTPGRGGMIRLDVAHGLRGGGTTVSGGWGAAWPW
jgi:predicted double-glycine peptidase